MGNNKGADSIEYAIVQMVQIWFDAASYSAPLNLSERVSSAIASVKYIYCNSDLSEFATKFSISFIKALEQNNGSAFLNEVENAVYRIDQIEPRTNEDVSKNGGQRLKRPNQNISQGSGCSGCDVAKKELPRSHVGPSFLDASSRKKHRSDSSTNIFRNSIPTTLLRKLPRK